MLRPTSPPTSISSWEELISVTFDIGKLQIVLESETHQTASVPCDDLAELHRLAKVSFALAEGHDLQLQWKIPITETNHE
jgi:hypothetical protein